ncbi:MAG: lactate racemase domain-containing protein [Candidatus Bathyarchaeota archaeon]|nr:lactate racemase domain-containing protein [Candidatus Bathyarchaeota archaeon]
MVECWLPYGNTEVFTTVNIRDLLGVAEPIHQDPTASPKEIVLKALSEPRGGKKLHELIGQDCSVAIALEGSITPSVVVPTLTVIIEQLVNLIIPKDKITVILANGSRGKSSVNLIKAIKGADELKGVAIVEHTKSSKSLIDVGKTNKGTTVLIEASYAEANLKIAIGEVNVDAYTGFTGAHTTIFPGIAALTSIEANRRLYYKGDVKPAVMELNPVKEDVFEAVKLAGIDMAFNLVVSNQGKLLSAFAGNFEETLGQSVYQLGSGYVVEAVAGADIIIVSAGGARFDHDLYSATWALQGANKLAKKGAAIILLAECIGGLGADSYINLAGVDQIGELERRYQIGSEALQLIKTITTKNDIWLVSSLPHILVEPLGLKTARTANEAYDKACEQRRSRRTLVIPYGCSTITNITS